MEVKKLLYIVALFGAVSTLFSTCTNSAKNSCAPTYKDVLQCLTCQPENITTAYENKVKETVESYVLSRFKARITKREHEKNIQPYIAKKIYKRIHLTAAYQSPKENNFFKKNPGAWGYCDQNCDHICIQKRASYKKSDAITLLFVIEHELTHLEHALNQRSGARYFLINTNTQNNNNSIGIVEEEHEADTEGVRNHPNPYLLFHALQWSFDHYNVKDIYNEKYDEYLPLPLKYDVAKKNYQDFYTRNPKELTKHMEQAKEYMPPGKTKKAWNLFKALDAPAQLPCICALVILLALLLNLCTRSRRFAIGPLALALACITLYNAGKQLVYPKSFRKHKISLCKTLHDTFVRSQSNL